MAIASNIPSNTLLPLFYADVTPAPEPISPNLKLLLIGHMNKGSGFGEGVAVANTMYPLVQEDATELFGAGSMLAWMYQAARANAPRSEIWGISIDEDPVAVRATGTITVVNGGNAVRQGVPIIWIAGVPVQIRVLSTDTAAQIATKLTAAINSSHLPVKATVASAVITITCRWAGATGNEIRCSFTGPHGRRGENQNSSRLARVLYNFSTPNMSAGAGEYLPAATISSIGGRPFDIFVYPQTGQTNMDIFQDFMDGIAGRWSPFQQLYGHTVTANIGSFSGLGTLADARNDPHQTILGIMQSIMPSWQWASSLAAVMLTHWAAPPELSRPLQTLELRGMFVGSDDDESFDPTERQILLEKGISTFHVDDDTTCRIDRVRTLRKTNVFGDPDPSWADAITMFQAQYLVRAMRAMIQGNFSRAALTTDESGIPGFASPMLIRLAIIHEYRRLEKLGLVENSNLFAQFLIVERDEVDRNRVNVLMRPDFVNQLRVVAAVVETHLELDPESVFLQAA